MNKRQIAKALSTAAFTPGKPGPMKVIADVGNINYYVRRATEFLTLSLTALTREQRVKYFDSALGLIALAKVKTQEEMPITIGDINRNVTSPLKITDPTKILVSVKNEMDKQDKDVPCTQDECDSGRCMASGICSGVNVLKAEKEVFGKGNNEVDKQDKDGEVQGTGNSVPPLGVFRDIPDPPDGCQSPRQISEETQPRPEAPFYAIDT